MAGPIRNVRELRACQAAVELQQAVFKISKTWPKAEKFSLTDQVRRSSRALGANLAEAWAKRNYPAHFVSKLTDADGELPETSHWLLTALDCEYITQIEPSNLQARIDDIGSKLGRVSKFRSAAVPGRSNERRRGDCGNFNEVGVRRWLRPGTGALRNRQNQILKTRPRQNDDPAGKIQTGTEVRGRRSEA